MSEPLQLNLAIPDELIERIADHIADRLRQRANDAAPTPVSPWLTFEQAREYLGFSRDTLYKLTAAKAIPLRKKQDGQGLRFHRDELDQWMRETYPRLDRSA
jgi:excisionase family DNA binding protein